MDKNSILLKTSGSHKKPLEKSKNPAYCFYTVAENSGQNWRSEFLEMHDSHPPIGEFFYACDIIASRVVVGYLEKSLDLLSSFKSSTPIPFNPLPYQLALVVIVVSNILKETAHV